MQCVILAAGKGTRLRPLTNDRPKPMVELLGKPVIQYVLEQVPDEVSEFIIVTGYRGDQIRSFVGESWNGKSVKYVHQEEQLGTAHALFLAQSLLDARFLVLLADDILDKVSLTNALSRRCCVFVKEHEDPTRFGVVEQDQNGLLSRIEEKPEKPRSNLVSTGAMILDPKIFELGLVKDARKGEYFIPDLLMQLMEEVPIHVVESAEWLTITEPSDIPRVEKMLQQHI